MRPFIASRIDSSSSTIEISGFAFGTRPPAPGLVMVMMRRDPRALWRRVIFTTSQKNETNSSARRLYFGLDTAVARANMSCTAPRSVSERYLGDLLVAASNNAGLPERAWAFVVHGQGK